MRAKSLVERILAFSRSGDGRARPGARAVGRGRSRSMSSTGRCPQASRSSVSLGAGDAAVLGDPTQMHQVVMNLCANAVQAIEGEGRVSVAMRHRSC